MVPAASTRWWDEIRLRQPRLNWISLNWHAFV
jgi:hypothetical protein